MKRSLSFAEIKKGAMEYVDAQIAIMEKYGSAPVLSPAEYYGLVESVVEVTLELRKKYGLATIEPAKEQP